MRYLNFDERFQAYMTEWVQNNAARFGNNYDRLEGKMPEVYLQWLNTPADWLDGMTPGGYFAQFDDAAALVQWMRAYFDKGDPVPDQLLERIIDLKEQGEGALHTLLLDETAPEEARLTAVAMLSQMQSLLPLSLYVRWIAHRTAEDERAEMASEALVAMGRVVVPYILEAVHAATAEGKETFADVLCNFPGEDAIYKLALSLFHTHTEKRALYASLLGKLGDDRALSHLLAAMDDTALNYLDYIELRNAVEALGGDAPPERSFDGDPYYESLRRME